MFYHGSLLFVAVFWCLAVSVLRDKTPSTAKPKNESPETKQQTKNNAPQNRTVPTFSVELCFFLSRSSKSSDGSTDTIGDKNTNAPVGAMF